MTKLFLLYSKYYDFESHGPTLGGVQTYMTCLIELSSRIGFGPIYVIQSGNGGHPAESCFGADVLEVSCKKNDYRVLARRAEELGDPTTDILIFCSSTIISRTSFKHAIGIQHGIYWDVPTIAGKTYKSDVVASTLRTIQAWGNLRKHCLVNTMVCVDCNYINWMRALTTARDKDCVYIPNFAETLSEDPERKNGNLEGEIRIVFARRFETYRGTELLAQTMPDLLRTHEILSLVIAGAGSKEGTLRDAFRGVPRVEFCTYESQDSVKFHSGFDIALVPSIGSEGTSLSLLEAMAAGCAVVATNVGGMTNIVLNEFNGLLVNPTADELGAAIERLIVDADLRRELGFNARQTVGAAFSKDIWDRRWTSILTSHVEGSGLNSL